MTTPETRPAHAVSIRPATLADAATLTELGARTFQDAFAADNTPEDLEAFLASHYRPEIQEAELREPSNLSGSMKRRVRFPPLLHEVARRHESNPLLRRRHGSNQAIQSLRVGPNPDAYRRGIEVPAGSGGLTVRARVIAPKA
jgi:hypothetical protein